jgi:UDP-N-acetylmuramate dehydrogenase
MKLPRPLIEALSEWGLIKENEPLKNYTTYRTGGPADVIVFPGKNDFISPIVKIAGEEKVPLTVIGGGSNLLVGDKGIEGIVMRLCEDDSRRPEMTLLEDGTLYTDAIGSKENFIAYAAGAGFSGMEFMAGIPGCIGGGVLMNAGTFMGSFVDILKDIDIIDASGARRTIVVDKAMSSYRKMDIGVGNIVTGARFRLARADNPAAVRNKIEEILADRRTKHPLNYPSAGSVFKNPEGYSSWKLIDDAGLKGATVGGACISDLHTNFIINVNHATSQDIKDLINLARDTVRKKFGIELEAEIKMIGVF